MPNNLSNLEWHLQMGVDEAVEETPINRFEKKTPEVMATKPTVKIIEPVQKEAAKPVVKPIATSTLQTQTKAASISDPKSTSLTTRKIADTCTTLDELRAAVLNFKDLSIAKTATNTVFADGNPDSEIMFIGEAPGAEEDAQGIPFCGASGQLLDQMLACIGLKREKNFYITNTIFWRPPGNRRPTPEELAICRPFVEKHISLIKPKLIVLVGGTAVTSLLNDNQGITKLRGNYYEYGNEYLNGTIETTAMFHPSYLLRSPGQKRVAWQDLLSLKEYISKNNIKI